MVDRNKNVMWVVGRQGTGKTTMAHFLKGSLTCNTCVLDMGDVPCNEVYETIDTFINNSSLNIKVVVLSQEMPAKYINGVPFNPIIIKLESHHEYL